MKFYDWPQIQSHIMQFEQEGLATRTFRRLDQDRQQTILMAILDEALEKGPTAINIKQVAARAGVAVGSLYSYFGNKDGLLDFTIELCARYMKDIITADMPNLAKLPLREALASFVTGGIEWSKTQAGLMSFFVRAAYYGDPKMSEQMVRPIAGAMRETMHSILTSAAKRGEIREDFDFEAVARVVYALMCMVCDSQAMPRLNTYFQVIDDDVPPDRLLDALIDFVLHGIAP